LAATDVLAANKERGRLDMTNPQDRQAGASGSTMGYEPGQPAPAQPGQDQGGQVQTEQTRAEARGGREAYGRDYGTGGRHADTEHRGAVVGFTGLGGTLMVLGGLWGVIVGIVALSSSHVYVHSVSSGYTYSWTLHGWGWIELILGIVVFAAGVCVFLGMPWARYVGAFLAVLSAIGNFIFIPYTPVWSIILIVLDAFIIWALLAPRRVHGEF
jgi:hypothetical protein